MSQEQDLHVVWGLLFFFFKPPSGGCSYHRPFLIFYKMSLADKIAQKGNNDMIYL